MNVSVPFVGFIAKALTAPSASSEVPDIADESLPELYIPIDHPIAQALNEIRRYGRGP
jgi:hypothetical protein